MKRKTIISWLFLLILIAVIVAVAFPYIASNPQSKFSYILSKSMNLSNSSTFVRYYNSYLGLKIFYNYPLTGVGPGLSRYYTNSYAQLRTEEFTTPAITIEIASEQGILGLIAYGMVMAIFISRMYRVHRNSKSLLHRTLGLGFCGSFISLLVSSFANSTWFRTDMWVFMGVAAAEMIVAQRDLTQHRADIIFVLPSVIEQRPVDSK